MQFWVGLGNPGTKYESNRHNIGFMALDRSADDQGAPWRAKLQGEVAEVRFGSQKIWLLKPGTFMNLSGQSVGEAMRFHKLEPGGGVGAVAELAPGFEQKGQCVGRDERRNPPSRRLARSDRACGWDRRSPCR